METVDYKHACHRCKDPLTSHNFHEKLIKRCQWECHACRKQTAAEYWQANRDRFNPIHRGRYAENKEKRRANNRAWYQRRKLSKGPTTLEQRAKDAVRARLGAAICGRAPKAARTLELIGCTTQELLRHLESLWLPGMSWENYGAYRVGGPMTWHIDHIMPCSSFDLTKPEEQRKCFHWTNMQPLWAVDNMSKGPKLPNAKAASG